MIDRRGEMLAIEPSLNSSPARRASTLGRLCAAALAALILVAAPVALAQQTGGAAAGQQGDGRDPGAGGRDGGQVGGLGAILAPDSGWRVSAALRIRCFRDCRGGAAADTRLCRSCLISTCCGSDLLQAVDPSCRPFLQFCPSSGGGGVVTPADLAPAGCDVEFCEQRYRSFRVSDCTFQPLSGPRRACVSPAQAAAAEDAQVEDARAEAPEGCDVDFCTDRYRTFRASDCTFQPLSGARRICQSPEQIAAEEADSAGDAPVGCDVSFCTGRYRSFRASDCTFQPFSGDRRLCVGPDGVTPGSAEALAAALADGTLRPDPNGDDDAAADGESERAEGEAQDDDNASDTAEDGRPRVDLDDLVDALAGGGGAAGDDQGAGRLTLPDLTSADGASDEGGSTFGVGGPGRGADGGAFGGATVWIVGGAGAATLALGLGLLLLRRRARGAVADGPVIAAEPEPTTFDAPVEPAPPAAQQDAPPPGDALHIGPRPDIGRQRIIPAGGGPLVGAARPVGDLGIPSPEDDA